MYHKSGIFQGLYLLQTISILCGGEEAKTPLLSPIKSKSTLDYPKNMFQSTLNNSELLSAGKGEGEIGMGHPVYVLKSVQGCVYLNEGRVDVSGMLPGRYRSQDHSISIEWNHRLTTILHRVFISTTYTMRFALFNNLNHFL